MPDPEAYFGQVPAVSSDLGEGNWFDLEREVAPFQMVPGLMFRPIVGEKVALNLVSFEPNTEARLHAHSEEQITYVLEGELEFMVGQRTLSATAGSVVYGPRNVLHAFKNVGVTPSKMVVLIMPAGLEKMFEELGEPVADPSSPPEGPPDIERLMAINEKYGVEVAPPPGP